MTCEGCGDCGPVNDAGYCKLCALELELELELEQRPTDPCAAPNPDEWEPVGGES
jgi:hypothetical protein